MTKSKVFRVKLDSHEVMKGLQSFFERLSRELPAKGPGSGLIVVLKVQHPLGQHGWIGHFHGGQNLALQNGKVKFDLVEPTGMDR